MDNSVKMKIISSLEKIYHSDKVPTNTLSYFSMLKNEKKITYSLHEQHYDRIVRTIESLKILQTLYPDDQIVFIAGADKMSFKWFQREELVRDFGIIVTNRGDVDCESIIASSKTLSKWKNNIQILDYCSDVSSTVVRDAIKNHQTTEFITEDVYNFIQKHNLFK